MTRVLIDLRLTEEVYTVLGSTAADLATGIAFLGPRLGGKPFGAATSWELEWSYEAHAKRQDFVLAKAVITLHAHIILPSWSAPRHAQSDVVCAFDRYRCRLRAHERGHVALALRAARRLRVLLASLPAQCSVEALMRHADELGHDAVAAGRLAERLYDLETNHGGGHQPSSFERWGAEA